MKNIYCTIKIKLGNNVNLDDLYKNINIPITVHEDGYLEYTDEDSRILAKGYGHYVEGSLTINRYPPRGPIPEHADCHYCKPVNNFHEQSCPGPYNDFIITDLNFPKFQNRLSEFGDEEKKEILDSFKKNGIIPYTILFPLRGKEKEFENEGRYARVFANVVEIKYRSDPIEDTGMYTVEHGEGIIVTVKITKDGVITFTNVPFEQYEDIVQDVVKTLFPENLPEGKIEITSLSGYLYLLEHPNKNLKLDFMADRFQNYPFFRYTGNFIIFNYFYTDAKVSVNIKKGGSVWITISRGNGTKLEKEKANSTLGKFGDFSQTEKLEKSVRQVLGFTDQDSYELIKEQFDKIMNTVIPYKILDNGNLQYFTKKNFPPQPSSCQNRIKPYTSFTKSDIKRPVPFSFSKGKPPMDGLTIRDEGIESKSKLLTQGGLLYEPCCEALRGDIPNILFHRYRSIILPEEFQEMVNKSENVKDNIEDIKKQLTIKKNGELKKKILRRVLFGFPNDKYVEDSAETNHILSGIEQVPKSRQIKFDKKNTVNPIKIYENKTQSDIHSAVYVPGTQFAAYNGNGQLIRDSRIFPGLFSLKKDTLLKIIELYFNKFQIKDYIPLDTEIASRKYPNLTKITKDDLLDDIIVFKVKKDENNDNLVRLFWPNTEEPLSNEYINLIDRNGLFLLKSDIKQIIKKSNKNWIFHFNYFNVLGNKELIYNQPFTPVKEYKEKVNPETQKKRLLAVMFPLED